jgi:aspartyl-tRNA(Asn)/glutamyl-tRNA(Gln) amidotransferase subunit C
MKVEDQLIKRLESLSMLSLSKEERDNLKPELEKMINMIDKLSEIDTNDIIPLINMNNHEQVLRSDKSGKMLSNDVAMKNTNHNSGVYFTVPKVLK